MLFFLSYCYCTVFCCIFVHFYRLAAVSKVAQTIIATMVLHGVLLIYFFLSFFCADGEIQLASPYRLYMVNPLVIDNDFGTVSRRPSLKSPEAQQFLIGL